MKTNNLTATLIRYKVLLLIGIGYIIIDLWPYVLDYYIAHSNSLGDFYMKNLLGAHYHFESIILFLSICVTYAFTRSFSFSVSFTIVSTTVLAFFSQIKFVSRSEMLNYTDFKMTQAAEMATEYLHITWDSYFITLVALTIAIVVISILLDRLLGEYKKRFSNKVKNACYLVAGIFLIIAGTFYIKGYHTKNNQFVSSTLNSQGLSEYKHFVIYQFLKSDTVGFDSVSAIYNLNELLEDSSRNTSDRIIDTTTKPNIIVVMNESWWNTDKITTDQITLSSDPMAPYKALMNRKGVSLGYASSNVYGGGSVSSEAELLTGLNTKYFTTSSGIYTTISGKTIPTIADYFDALDYQTVGMHPYYYEFYNRDKVYPYFKFDKTLFYQDFDYNEIYTKYLSDDSMVSQIIHEYENSEEPIFVWAATLANHRWTLPYEWENITDYDYPISVDFHGNDVDQIDKDRFVNYVNGIYLANLALTRLIDYFESAGEPTVILMYGDHLFDLPDSILSLCGFDKESDDIAMKEILYTTNVALWTNCTDTKFEIAGDNINFLSSYVFEAANLPDCTMTKLLRNERNTIKADTRFYMLNPDGSPIEKLTDEQASTLLKFESVQYDIMIGDCEVGNLWLPMKE